MSGRRLTALLTGAVLGVYLLVVAGATAAIAAAARACGSWPLCAPDSPAALIALGHRGAAAFVGVVVLATAIAAWRAGSRRVRLATFVAVVLFPIQVGVGAAVVLAGAPTTLSVLHLGAGMAIFGALVLALAWHLEAETGLDAAVVAVDPRDDGTATDPSPEPTTGLGRVRRTVGAYLSLMKPRLMWLLCLVASAGMALAAGPRLTVGTVVATLGGGVLAIGASGTFNHVLERDVDRRMARTSDRPVATDVVPVRNAVAFGLFLTVASVAAFLTLNLLAAALGLAAIMFYAVVYTLVLKPNTVQNTVIGGAAGALPALIGWVAVTGTIGVPALALAGVVFLWTPAHFYNLALAYRKDYERGGFPMLPVVRGEAVTRKHVLLYLGATLLAAASLAALADLGVVYALTTLSLGGVFLWAVVALHRERTKAAAFRAFHASNAYLGLLLVAIVVDALAV